MIEYIRYFWIEFSKGLRGELSEGPSWYEYRLSRMSDEELDREIYRDKI